MVSRKSGQVWYHLKWFLKLYNLRLRFWAIQIRVLFELWLIFHARTFGEITCCNQLVALQIIAKIICLQCLIFKFAANVQLNWIHSISCKQWVAMTVAMNCCIEWVALFNLNLGCLYWRVGVPKVTESNPSYRGV